MELKTIKAYTDQYMPGMKKITYRTYRPKIENGNINYTHKRFSLDNYDLYFSNSGILLYSIHRTDNPFRIIYGYDNMRNIVHALELSLTNSTLIEFSEFVYDDQKRIEFEFSRAFCYKPHFETFCDIEHKYYESMEEILITSNANFKEEEYYCLVVLKNGEELLIEQKSQEKNGELFFWYKYNYNAEGKCISSISYNANGDIDEILPENPIYVFEEKYEFEKNVWVKKIDLRNGEPYIYVERDIEYF